MLEILNNRTENTHENEQFRRVVNIIESIFEQYDYNGILIGNPFNELFYRFRADALLYYDNGIVIIDFKDYKGIIKLPPNENEFHTAKWHNESLKDRSRLEIKAGAHFINPFRQLVSYRNAFRELVEKNKYFKDINLARVCIANIFTGPIEIHNEVPRNLPYYKLIQESDLGNFLYDFASENSYIQENANIFKNIFPAEKWIKKLEVSVIEQINEKQITKIDSEVEENIVNFLRDEKGGILVLESMDTEDRDALFRFISTEALDHNIPQIEKWSHSARISKKIQRRSNLETEGIYKVIYGGSEVTGQNDDSSDESRQDELLEVIPLKSNKEIDDKALIIIAEAHLISRSLSQSELLRFGSGRLLEDIIKFLNPESNRKIVFIGDPYSLTFGKDEDSALNLVTLSELYDKSKIKHYRKPIDRNFKEGKNKLLVDLATSIEKSLFNNLNYVFNETTLIDLKDDSQRIQNLHLWFSKPFLKEPENAVLFYSKKDCLKTNKWIKKQCLKNGEHLAVGDLLIVNNNVSLPDETGFQIPRRIVNGMFLTVLEVKDSQQIIIKIRQSQNPIELSFSKIKVKCLSLLGLPETHIWILDNYFNNEEDLTKEEQIAFSVFVNSKINDEKLKQKFEDSSEHKQLLHDNQYNNLLEEEKEAIKVLVKNYHLPKEKKVKVKTNSQTRNFLASYYNKYSKKLFFQIKDSDPFVNAVFVKYGWAITVHKAIGSNYDEIILKGHRKENDGITNDSYFRWLYSGVTAGNIVNIISPKKINPLMDCVFEDNSKNGVSKKSKQILIFENYQTDLKYATKVESLENINVIGAICEISKLLELNGYILESTKNYSEHLTKASYSIPKSEKSQLILIIDSKGEKDNFAVSNIRIDKLSSADESIVKNCIDNCKEEKQSLNVIADDKPELPKDFRKEVYSIWFENCENEKIILKIIQNHNNQDIFRASYEKASLTFRVWYGTSEKNHSKGFLTKIEVLENSSDLLLTLIKKICLGITE